VASNFASWPMSRISPEMAQNWLPRRPLRCPPSVRRIASTGDTCPVRGSHARRRAPYSLPHVLTLPLMFGQQGAPQRTPSSLASPSSLTFSPRARRARPRHGRADKAPCCRLCLASTAASARANRVIMFSSSHRHHRPSPAASLAAATPHQRGSCRLPVQTSGRSCTPCLRLSQARLTLPNTVTALS
jgi:hypothetical protein